MSNIFGNTYMARPSVYSYLAICSQKGNVKHFFIPKEEKEASLSQNYQCIYTSADWTKTDY